MLGILLLAAIPVNLAVLLVDARSAFVGVFHIRLVIAWLDFFAHRIRSFPHSHCSKKAEFQLKFVLCVENF